MRSQLEGHRPRIRKRTLTRSQICWHLNLGLPSLQNYEIGIFCLSHPGVVFCCDSPSRPTCRLHPALHAFVSSSACVCAQLCPTLCMYCIPPSIVSHQAPLSMECSRQEYWSGLLLPTPGDLFHLGTEAMPPALAGGFFTTEPPGKPPFPHTSPYSLTESDFTPPPLQGPCSSQGHGPLLSSRALLSHIQHHRPPSLS